MIYIKIKKVFLLINVELYYSLSSLHAKKTCVCSDVHYQFFNNKEEKFICSSINTACVHFIVGKCNDVNVICYNTTLVLGLHYVCLCEFYYKFKLVYWFNQKHQIWKSKNIFPFWSICSALNKFTKRVNNVWICYIIQSNLSIADTCGFWKLYLLQPGIRYIEVRIFLRENVS